jgi:hypothetical protein
VQSKKKQQNSLQELWIADEEQTSSRPAGQRGRACEGERERRPEEIAGDNDLVFSKATRWTIGCVAGSSRWNEFKTAEFEEFMVLDDLFHPAFLGTVFHPLLSGVADIKVTVPT